MWDVVGQDRAVAGLKGALARGRLAHAYLFVGPANVGKATLARRLAQALNCQGTEPGPGLAEEGPLRRAQDGPCGQCSSCQRIERGVHADVRTVTIEADSERAHKDIGIDQIRELEREVSLQPYEGRYRVVLVDPAEAMSVQAQNAFLKTLEEPPPHVIFVLAACQEGALLATVRSRCQRVELATLSAAQVEVALRERWGAPSGEAQLLARLCRGRPGWAIAAVLDRKLLQGRDETLRELSRLPGRSLGERFAWGAALAFQFNRDRQAVLATLDLWLEWWWDVLLVVTGCEDQVVNRHLLGELKATAASHDAAAALGFLGAVRAARGHLLENANPRLTLDVLLLELPGPNLKVGEANAAPAGIGG